MKAKFFFKLKLNNRCFYIIKNKYKYKNGDC